MSVVPVRGSTAGLIRSIVVSPGDYVRAGQTIATIDTQAFRITLRQLHAQRASILIARRRLREAAPIDSAQHEAEMLAAKARKVAALASVRARIADNQIRGNLDSLISHFQPGNHVDLDQAISNLQIVEAEIRSRDAAERLLHLKRFDLETLESELAKVDAQIEEVSLDLSRATIVAPVDGVVLSEQIRLRRDTRLQEGEMLLELASLASWRAVLRVVERDVHKLQVGDPTSLRIQAMNEDEGAELEGKVHHIALEPDEGGTYPVEVELGAEALGRVGVDRLRRGLAVRGHVVVGERTIAGHWLRKLRGRARSFREAVR